MVKMISLRITPTIQWHWRLQIELHEKNRDRQTATNIHEVSKSVRKTVTKIDRQPDVSPVRDMDIPADERLFSVRQ